MGISPNRTLARTDATLLVTDGRIVACVTIASAAGQLEDDILIELRDLWMYCAGDSLWWYHHASLRRAIDMVNTELSRRPDAV